MKIIFRLIAAIIILIAVIAHMITTQDFGVINTLVVILLLVSISSLSYVLYKQNSDSKPA